jgi:hypothetical protein
LIVQYGRLMIVTRMTIVELLTRLAAPTSIAACLNTNVVIRLFQRDFSRNREFVGAETPRVSD